MRHDFGIWRTYRREGVLQQSFAAFFLVLICSVAACLAQAPTLPAYVTLPAQVQLKPNSIQEDYGEAEFNISGKPNAVQRGRH
jgi:hypothetical protein